MSLMAINVIYAEHYLSGIKDIIAWSAKTLICVRSVTQFDQRGMLISISNK